MDMGSSDDEEEDGQISKFEEEEDQERKHFSKTSPEDEGPITIEDMEQVRLTRDMVVKHGFAPWFVEYAKGTFRSCPHTLSRR